MATQTELQSSNFEQFQSKARLSPSDLYYDLTSEGSPKISAEVSRHGAGLSRLFINGHPILVPRPPDPKEGFPDIRHGIFPMFPFVGHKYQDYVPYFPGFRHGPLRHSVFKQWVSTIPGRLIALVHEPLTDQVLYHGPFRVFSTVELLRDDIAVTHLVCNIGQETAYFSFGLHPYFAEPVTVENITKPEVGKSVLVPGQEHIKLTSGDQPLLITLDPVPSNLLLWKGDETYFCVEPVWINQSLGPSRQASFKWTVTTL